MPKYSSKLPTGLVARRLDACDRVGQIDLGRGDSVDRGYDHPAILCGQHGDFVNARVGLITRPNQCGFEGCRVGETCQGRRIRSYSWRCAIHGDKQCVLRPMYGLCGVRVGEASHPGPVQTRNARRRLQSTQVDRDDPPVRSGRFALQALKRCQKTSRFRGRCC